MPAAEPNCVVSTRPPVAVQRDHKLPIAGVAVISVDAGIQQCCEELSRLTGAVEGPQVPLPGRLIERHAAVLEEIGLRPVSAAGQAVAAAGGDSNRVVALSAPNHGEQRAPGDGCRADGAQAEL